jgi:hypothetical protein
MSAGFEAVVRYFEEHQWRFDKHEDERIINLGFSGEHGQFRCAAVINEDDDMFQFFTFVPLRIHAERRQEVAEFVTRANYGMKIGKFELDFDDGELRFHTSARYSDQSLPSEIIRDIIGINLVTADRYFPALTRLLFSGFTPADAIESVEGGPGRHSRRWDVAG